MKSGSPVRGLTGGSSPLTNLCSAGEHVMTHVTNTNPTNRTGVVFNWDILAWGACKHGVINLIRDSIC